MYKYSRVNSTHENMLRAVVAFALSSTNLPATSLLPAFLTIINTIKSNLDTVETLRAAIAQAITGYAAQKKALRNALTEMSVTIMKAAYAYAVANGNVTLAAKMKTSRSRLKNMKYINLTAYVQGSINLISPLVASLGDYGITPTMLTLWQTEKDKLEQVVSNPKNAIARRTAVNKDIQNTLRQCMILLTEQADQIGLSFKTLNENYYNQYLANRRLNPHHLSTQLRAHVQDELGQPLKEATVAINGTELSNITSENGYSLISGIPFGEHTVTVTTGTNIRTFGPFLFKKGKSLTKYFTTAPPFVTLEKQEHIYLE
jgi:hypothetical protein